MDRTINAARSIFSELSIGLIVFHAEDLSETDKIKLVYANHRASEYTGTDLNQLVGEYIFEAFPALAETDIPKLCLEVARTKKSQNLGAVEYGDDHVRKGCYAVKAFPMPKDCIGLTLEDITLRKKAEEMIKGYTKQLQRKNDELQAFVSMVSHDLTSPLRCVQSYAEELTNSVGASLPEKDSEKLDKIVDTSSSLTRLVEDLMVYSKIGQSREKKTEVKLSEIINQVLSDLEELIIETGGKVEADKLGTVEAVPCEMQILLHTLIENGLKCHRDGIPHIVKVSGEKSKDSYRIMIKDNGVGFDEKQAGKIMWAFRDLQVKSGKYLGVGVGLSTCIKIVESHRGDFKAEGKTGEGSTFILTLPIKQFQ